MQSDHPFPVKFYSHPRFSNAKFCFVDSPVWEKCLIWYQYVRIQWYVPNFKLMWAHKLDLLVTENLYTSWILRCISELYTRPHQRKCPRIMVKFYKFHKFHKFLYTMAIETANLSDYHEESIIIIMCIYLIGYNTYIQTAASLTTWMRGSLTLVPISPFAPAWYAWIYTRQLKHVTDDAMYVRDQKPWIYHCTCAHNVHIHTEFTQNYTQGFVYTSSRHAVYHSQHRFRSYTDCDNPHHYRGRNST